MLPERDRYFPPVIAGIEAAAVHTRTTIDLYTTGYADRGWDRLTHLADHLAGAEGLLITHPGPADAATPAHTRLLRKLPLPYVLLERTPSGIDDPSEHVSTDHAGGAYLALAHLAALGHRDVALACRTDSAPSHGISTGFIQGAATLGLSVAARFDWPSITGRANFEDVLAAQPLLADAALDSVLGSGATGLVCFGDMEGSALLAPPAGPGCASPATSPWSLARTGTSPPSRCRSLRSRRRSSGSAGWP
ncbi:hypothetical protein ACGF0K_31715 [Streptomyces sp. NPDC048156]|uniref:hypothetical protein n=1 Tax=Streptomyces sp. NPDC048156 TaxID=3365502 RepID=UPI0037116BF6